MFSSRIENLLSRMSEAFFTTNGIIGIQSAKTATRILNSTLIFIKIVAVEIKSKNAVMHNIL